MDEPAGLAELWGTETSPKSESSLESGSTRLSDSDLSALSLQLRASLNGEDFPTFCREILRLKTPTHYLEWWDLAEAHTRLHIQAHRDSWKSFFWSRAYPLFRAVSRPGAAICLISYSEVQARKNLYWIKQMVETVPELRSQFLPKSNTLMWQKTFLHLANGSTIECKGFGSAMRGGHFDLIVGDDLLKDGSSMPHDDQDDFFFGVISPACRKTGQIVVVGTPLEHGDLLETLEQNEIYVTRKYPALIPDPNPLNSGAKIVWFSEEYDMATVERWRKESPNYWYFAREYLLQRINPEKASFKPEQLVYYNPRDTEFDFERNGTQLFKVMTLDPALSEKGDANGIIVTGTDAHNFTYSLEAIKMRADLTTIIDRIFSLYEKHKPDVVGCEMFGFQKYLKFWLEEEMAKRNVFFHIVQLEAGQKRSKAMRILGLQPKIEAGRLKFRKNEDSDLVGQLLGWDYSRRDNDDDLIDSLAYQVSLWRIPTAPRPAGAPEGAFDKVAAAASAAAPMDYVRELFADMGDPDGGEGDEFDTGYVSL